MNTKERLIEFIDYLNIPISKFEKECDMSNGYISSMRKGLGSQKLNNVLNKYPELNREWLLYGEGEMINQNIQTGDGTNIVGDKNNVNDGNALALAINEISAQRRLVEKSQEQIDRLIKIIEKSTEK